MAATISRSTVQLSLQLSAGPHSLSAAYSGDARNFASQSASVAYNVGDPNGLPTITLSRIGDGASLVANSSGVLSGAVINISATVAPGNAFNQVTIFFSNGGAPAPWAPPAGTTSWSQAWTVPDTPPGGMYSIYATVTDNAGHTVTTPPIRFVVNPSGGTPPSVAITAPASGSTSTAAPPSPSRRCCRDL